MRSGGHPHLAAQSLERCLASFEHLRQELECDGLTEEQVRRAVDLAHTALSQAGGNPVALGQDRARREPALFRR